MASDVCGICQQINCNQNMSESQFRSATAQILCGILLNTDVMGTRVNVIILCDDNGPFLEFITVDATGAHITTYTTLNGVTPYVPVGVVHVCAEGAAPTLDILAALNDPLPLKGLVSGFSDGGNLRAARVHDLNLLPGVFEFNLGVNLRRSAPGGSIEIGTVANPIIVDLADAPVEPTSLSKTYVAANSINATTVKPAPGILSSYDIVNLQSGDTVFVKFYDKAAPPNPAVDIPVYVVAVPEDESARVSLSRPIRFLNGISFVTVQGIANTDTTAVDAGGAVISLGYE